MHSLLFWSTVMSEMISSSLKFIFAKDSVSNYELEN
jgi:hypothetical protein